MKKNLILIFSFLVCGLSYAQINHSMEFDGTAEKLFGTANYTLLGESFTAEVWIKSVASFNTILVYNDNSAPLIIDNGKLRTCVVGDCYEAPSNPVNDGTWHHIAVTGSGSHVTGYVDGVQVFQQAPRPGTMVNNQPFGIAGNHELNNFSGQLVTGNLDELRLWDIPLSQSQIQANMNTELSGMEANLVAYFKFDDDGASCDVVDCTANETHMARTGTTPSGTNPIPQYSTDVPSLTDAACGVSFSNCTVSPPSIPTMGEWALITLGLIILSIGVLSVMRWQKQMALSV